MMALRFALVCVFVVWLAFAGVRLYCELIVLVHAWGVRLDVLPAM